jgi:hypothetical protein
MNTKGNLALAVLAGISIGAVSVMAVHAQEAKTPPAYLIAETDVTDRAARTLVLSSMNLIIA